MDPVIIPPEELNNRYLSLVGKDWVRKFHEWTSLPSGFSRLDEVSIRSWSAPYPGTEILRVPIPVPPEMLTSPLVTTTSNHD